MLIIGKDLVEAYMGVNEDEWNREWDKAISEEKTDMSCEAYARDRAHIVIAEHTARQRLEVYLEWNGIIGYADRIYEIATGEC